MKCFTEAEIREIILNSFFNNVVNKEKVIILVLLVSPFSNSNLIYTDFHVCNYCLRTGILLRSD